MSLRQQPTLDEFLAWPEKKPYLEYIHGEVRQKAMPNAAHSYLQSQLAKRLANWRDYPQGFVLTEQRCILVSGGETHTLLPDVAWFSPEQLPVLPAGPVRVPPTLVVEIVSPDDSFSEVEEKVLTYLGAGVNLVWVVDPKARKVSVHRLGHPPVFVGRNDVLQDALLPGLAISLAELFAPLPESSQPV
ncbi:MAG TPA: Uma2 family endonuclease [Candidatus Xenobia bacterium]|jgi:Uma2 family endonuclease